jgi:hypothetical protein
MLTDGLDRPRRVALAALAAATLAAHLLLLGGVEIGVPLPEAPRSTAAVQVRTLSAPVAAVAEPAPAGPAPRAEAVPRPPVPRPRPATAVAEAAAAAAAEPAAVTAEAPGADAEPVLDVPPLERGLPPLEPTVADAVASPASEAEGAAPLYATRLPPPMTLRYELRRGRLNGGGELAWRPDGGRYRLSLQGSVIGLNVLTQVSEGALDEHGLAPVRFTDQRARRPMVAANFEREAGRIRFSGPSHEVPWQAGVQDRLSWMVQLAAVAEAEPARLTAGGHIVLQVVGARGDATTWTFLSLGEETLNLFSEPFHTVRLLRTPRHPYDTRVEVWLDPARHHLPIHATMGSGEDDRIELRLREMIP